MVSSPKDNPVFSVVIPTYNNPSVLKRCLESLSAQNAESASFEVVLINDGDQGVLPEILRSFRGKMPLTYLMQDHRGPAAARNLGISKSRGDIVLFLDDDSQPARDWLAATALAWRRYPDCAGIGGMTINDPGDSLLSRVNADIFNWYLKANSSADNCAFLSTHNAGYRKVALEKAGRFDENFRSASGEDRDLSIKISQSGGRLRVDENILVYHDRDLRLSMFAKKYFGYGKAAKAIYRKYPTVKGISAGRYGLLAADILSRYTAYNDKIYALSLFLLSQIATLAGYLMERPTRSRRSHEQG